MNGVVQQMDTGPLAWMGQEDKQEGLDLVQWSSKHA